ncbi:hypothetical protein [Novosphingobium sp. AP12]|uniref:hypothetical protein n=1 Tax=Novosphingobium sp. AP12 TaxID=1144305 RepID=UPI000271E297|nr:hypothetical protein [Novosphingobium sp. AP12]EJL24666.1 hypothetical protein PMI02_03592 [Novosphingobium sp. AP12]
MSSDRRPAKVRVVSSGAIRSADGAAAPTPARRRSDEPQGEVGAASVAAPKAVEGTSLLWIAGALSLFLVGCAIGGALFVVSGLAAEPPL